MRLDPCQSRLVLRREAFGGILFDPADGTYVELDADGFEVVRAWICDARAPAGPDQARLLREVRAQVASLDAGQRGPVRRIDDLPLQASHRFAQVLASPTLVDLQVTRRCNMACPHCYASSESDGAHMRLEDASRVLRQAAAAGVCQVAIGGGEPLLHPAVAEIIAEAYALGVVPNVSTTGDGLTPRVLDEMARCCGAVALSLEGLGTEFAKRRRAGFAFFESSARRLRDKGIRVVFQVTLSAENAPALPAIVDYCLACPDLYGVIFLAYKSVGRGEGFHTPLAALDPAHLYPLLRDAFLRLAAHTRVGYDCCLTPGIVGIDVEMGFGDRDLLEGCSAARSSVGVTTELDVVPCTFAVHRPLGSLRERTLMDIWNGAEARSFRERLDALGDRDEACRECPSRPSCLGGCPEWDLVRCSRGSESGPTCEPARPRG
jgi:radical SAM protein with 4Fe4S-binding SPASM domain